MNAGDERQRILDLLAAGQLTATQANALLQALAGNPDTPNKARTPTARNVRISVDVNDPEGGKENVRIRVNIPLGLAKFASRFLPAEARSELDAQGVDLAEIIAALSSDTPEGKLVDIDVDDDAGKVVKVVVEVA